MHLIVNALWIQFWCKNIWNHTCELCIRYIVLVLLHHCTDLSGNSITKSGVKLCRTEACWNIALQEQSCLSAYLLQAAPQCSCSLAAPLPLTSQHEDGSMPPLPALPLTTSRGRRSWLKGFLCQSPFPFLTEKKKKGVLLFSMVSK